MNRWSFAGFALTAAVVGVLTLSTTSGGATPTRPAAAPRAPLLAADPQLSPETHFVSMAPCRIIDTRVAGGSLASGASRSFYVSGSTGFATQGGHSGGCGVPTAATSVAATVAVVKGASSGIGYLKAFPTGSSEPNAVVLNYGSASGAVSTGATVPIRSLGGLSLTVKNHSATVSVVVDVSGYYIPQIQGLIAADGTVSAGTSRIVSAQHTGTGFYYVTLDRPARECAPQAVTYNLNRYASVGLSSSSTPNVISVSTWSLGSGGTYSATDYSFFLTVSC